MCDKIINDEFSFRSEDFQKKIVQIIEYAIGIILSIALIVGGIKKRLLFLGIWLMAALAGTMFLIYVGVSFLMFIPYYGFEMLIPILAVGSLTTLILFPVCSLFGQICIERSRTKKKQIEDDEGFREKSSAGTKHEEVSKVV
ncbi:uncharacterized protein [Musca autumnalis]|uniref:uncharacterized protein n=1 Tax=Musca autumnalis TaxID=221902 RepID=UPI003CFAE8D5